GGKLDDVTAATTETNADAGKLFGNNGDAEAGDASKAAAAVSGVSGEQILKQIVDAAGKAAGDQNGAAANAAANPIAAAIGTGANGAAFNEEGMKKDDQIAAAIVLRGMAKDGKFGLNAVNDDANGKGGVKNAVESAVKLLEKLITAGKEVEKVDFGSDSIGNVVAQGAAAAANEESVKGIAKGIKGIVDAAGGKLDDVTAATTETNADAGKLFGNNGAAAAGDASKAAAAVSGVSGEQILKQIVAAAGKGEQNGAAAANAANPIQAAIGTGANAAAFNADGMKKDDQIAAAIVLRGMAKDGKFGLQNADDDNGKGGVKNAVESAVKLLEKLITAGKEVVEKVDFGSDSIGNVVAQGDAVAADANSVKGIAKGIKRIVDAAGGKLDNVTAATTDTNADA
ncbi:variable large family protein, partial [Borreliella bavariensis]|uniref:variable large family protein n=1 Tax=Borreliella bavariensis TaxID=664662 RepID=UPI002D7E189C